MDTDSLFYLTMVIAFLTVGLVLQTTYLYTKMLGSRTAGFFLLVQGSLILWEVLRLSEAYAPTLATQHSNRMIQYGLLFLSIICLGCLIGALEQKQWMRKQAEITLIALIGLVLITTLMKRRTILYYFVPILPSQLLNLMLWSRTRKNASPVGNLSLKTAIQSMGDCILVLDSKQRIMDANYSFFELYFSMGKPGTYEEFCNKLNVAGVFHKDNNPPSLKDLLLIEEEQEVEFLLGEESIICSCKTSTLSDEKGESIGSMISFHDITPYRRLLQELENKKRELTEIQDKLQDYLLVVDRLEAAKEKREIFLKIQNSIGQEIMELLTMLEVVQLKSDNVSLQELELAVETCRSIIGRIRFSVSEIESE